MLHLEGGGIESNSKEIHPFFFQQATFNTLQLFWTIVLCLYRRFSRVYWQSSGIHCLVDIGYLGLFCPCDASCSSLLNQCFTTRPRDWTYSHIFKLLQPLSHRTSVGYFGSLYIQYQVSIFNRFVHSFW